MMKQSAVKRTLALLLAAVLCLLPAAALAQEPPENSGTENIVQSPPETTPEEESASHEIPSGEEAPPPDPLPEDEPRDTGDQSGEEAGEAGPRAANFQPAALPPTGVGATTITNFHALPPTTTGSWNFTGGVLTITGNGEFVIQSDGTQTGNVIVVDPGLTDVTVTLENVNIQTSTTHAFDMAGATVDLWLVGTNTLETNDNPSAGVHVPAGASLTIGGPGSLTAKNYIIGFGYGAGIGGGHGENGGSVTVTGGQVRAESYNGAGIGGGGNTGGGNPAGHGGDVVVSGGSVTATSFAGAGVGGGYSLLDSGGNGGRVTVTGGSLTVISTPSAAIGGGNHFWGTAGDGADIVITGGAVTAHSSGGADIGGGDAGVHQGTLRVEGGATLDLQGGGAAVDRTGGSLTIGKCVITDADGGGFGDLTGNYHWLRVEDGALDAASAIADHWLADSANGQIVPAGHPVEVTATLPAFEQWDASPNLTLTDDERRAATLSFAMPDGDAWITATAATSSGGGTGGGSGGGTGNGGSNVSNPPAAVPLTPASHTWTGGVEGLTFTAQGVTPLALLGVLVDGETLDPAHYTVREGSVVLTLTADYLATLSPGSHTLTLRFWNSSATAQFTVAQVDKAIDPSQPLGDGNVNDNPGTGAARGVAWSWAALLAAAGCLAWSHRGGRDRG